MVDDAVRQVRLPEPAPIKPVFLEAVPGRDIQTGIDELEADGVTDIVTVPMFISSGSTHVDEIAYALGAKEAPEAETDMRPFRRTARIRMGAPIDDDPDIAAVLLDRVRPMSERPEREAIVLVGHGSDVPGFEERWRNGLQRLADRLGRLGGFAAADSATLLPDRLTERLSWWTEDRPELEVLVVPLFLSEGYFTKKALPARLQGFRCRYRSSALLPHPLVGRWIERQIAAVWP
jgi:sirohydrochlorin ferrochelatase